MENNQKNVPVEQKQSPKGIFIPKSTLTIFGIIISGILIFSIFFYTGSFFSKRSKNQPSQLNNEITKKQKLTPKITGITEVPYGDENLDKDPNYKKAMEQQTNQDISRQPTPLITYKNDQYQFSFDYPSTVFIEPSNKADLPIVFVDTQLIVIPQDGFGGPLTPVEISKSSFNNQLKETVSSFKGLIYPDSYKEKVLSSPLKGLWLSGTARGFLDGIHHELVLLEGSKGLIEVSFFSDDRFSQELFDQIIASFKYQ